MNGISFNFIIIENKKYNDKDKLDRYNYEVYNKTEIDFYDIEDKLVLGNATQVSLATLLKTSDVVSLHVPETAQTQNMIGEAASRSSLDLPGRQQDLLDAVIASFLMTGSVAWLYYSDRLLEFPLGMFGIAIATVILPSLSRQFATENHHEFKRTLDWSVSLICLLGLPSMAATTPLPPSSLASATVR